MTYIFVASNPVYGCVIHDNYMRPNIVHRLPLTLRKYHEIYTWSCTPYE